MKPYDQTLQRSSELALAESCKRVAEADNTRNTLQHEARLVGCLVYGGLLEFYSAWCELLISAVTGGLDQDEIAPLLRDAFAQAKAKPAKVQLRIVEVVA